MLALAHLAPQVCFRAGAQSRAFPATMQESARTSSAHAAWHHRVVEKRRASRVRMRDVAEHAGVSVRTVSNVVNDYVYVKEDTRQRVQASLDELGYQMDYVARGLRSGRTNMIALVVPQLAEPYFAQVAQAIIRAAARRHLSVLIETTEDDPDIERRVMKGALSTVADGVLLSASSASMEEPPDVPLVLLGEHAATRHGDHVGIDNVAAARTVVRHLLGEGYRRVALLGLGGSATAALRFEGARQELSEWGIKPSRRLELPTDDWSPSGGYDAVNTLLDKRVGALPDAVFAFNDSLAIGAMRALREHGVVVPTQVAVAGIDDLEQSAYLDPPLTSLAPDLEDIAECALAALELQIEGKVGRKRYRRKFTAFELKVRGSTQRA
ncbi:LacI family transcriptional regulator [Jatrophihabitans telluris]|uniref:LacI family transcriptional regulator n=1 Tax=Jatrophihabitans telluris TaxID=2038343 RepID=A0ABY4R2B5_9ACTN|nr:LacI family DNA-binding transcriptional regulator [Jatrophihabitans telluris]UQX89184.1 LacI family transcriptional regulator [Jatrophihabitans telluris]